MDQITLKNFRCFREEQTARLAPLTLLVGENSTGKTSFLALVRALMDLALGSPVPDFKREPYDLGSFEDIAYFSGGREVQAATFEAGFCVIPLAQQGEVASSVPFHLEATFGRRGTAPFPIKIRRSFGETFIQEQFEADQSYLVNVGTSRGAWQKKVSLERYAGLGGAYVSPSAIAVMRSLTINDEELIDSTAFVPEATSPTLVSEDEQQLLSLLYPRMTNATSHPFASAPVRSKPRRTYDPASITLDPEGDYVPMYLARMSNQGDPAWIDLKQRLEEFGRASGLFDEIAVKHLGKRESDPFQMQVRKGGKRKGPFRNLIDVGYGVSQALPVITELLRPGAPSMFLLQQPEVHLHPRAQAALGSLFCQVASPERQLIIETHSDHLIDRVRMDVRDGDSDLKPEDVSILFFERTDLDVRIHSIRIDEEGNIVGAPDSYGSFFMEETSRSIWKRRKSTVG